MTEFELDKQSFKDLGIFVDKISEQSISSIYNQTKTVGGKDYLYHLMNNPITDIDELRERTTLIQFIRDEGFDLKINSGQFDYIEHYKKLNRDPLSHAKIQALAQYLEYQISQNNDYYLIEVGVQQLVYLFIQLKEKFTELLVPETCVKLKGYQEEILNVVEHPDFQFIYSNPEKISFLTLNTLDNLFRDKYIDQIKDLIYTVYKLDAYISIANVFKQKQFVLPEYLDSSYPVLYLEEFYHPLLQNAKPYSVTIDESCNLSFLTGPNMAGKSTFLKSVGVSVYLAHLGFPVPASHMTTSIYHGIITAINLSDDIQLGRSHFYNEVYRLKEAAIKIKEKGRLLVIFDELFRGTNVKDAYDGSLLVIKAFSEIKDCTFFISTHITEVAQEIESVRNIQFKRFKSKLIDNIPTYTYKLEDGISHERLGMYILKNEGVVDILYSISNKS